ncbi:HelD family protein [Desnuesiella massiliensis]|uniref:HelD family protein n=1 Tax=Desnuesiella massiliensis TaxID=1650662 RepID=UPI0006E19CCF|nr:UvrD-helicase domain-containing protein [Desnuesiella massiliensis]
MDKDLLKGNENSLELQTEKLKLEETIQIINAEILNYISKRKYMTEYILDYRKNIIEEYRDDEDKLIEYFDHERYVKEEAFKTIDRRLKELTALLSSPYFGKVSFREEDFNDQEEIYIGKFGVTPEGSYEPVVLDWRAPVASLFYTGNLGEASYKSPQGPINTEILARRQFIIKNGKLKGMFDSALDVKDEILQMVLSSNSGEKLKDIIMTIQKEQDEIIRQNKNGIVVVNGVAGSGKTTIALHRIAYLLYNFRSSLQDKILILGPNSIFMEYIANVLPSLGEVGVRQSTFKEFALSILNLNDHIMDFKAYIERVLSSDRELTQDIKYKNSDSYIEKLDELIQDKNNSYFKIEDAYFRDEVVVTSEQIEEMFNKHYSYMPLFRRCKKIKRIIISKIKDKRDHIFRDMELKYKKYKESLSPEKLRLEENNIEFQRKNDIRDLVRDVAKAKEALHWLNPGSAEEIYLQFNEFKTLIPEDLAPMLYIKIKLEGIKYKSDIKHIVIDEAQDYSKLQFRVIKELTGCSSFTVVGDVNQRLIPYDEEAAMLNLEIIFNEVPMSKFSLNKSYRSTKEIMEYANKYLKKETIVPFVRSGDEVLTQEIYSLENLAHIVKEKAEEFYKKGYESVALICKNEKQIHKLQSKIKEELLVKVIDNEDIIYTGGTVLIPSYYAKGLEFDGVIIIDDEPKNNEENLIKYIMCTRALHELCVLNFKEF